MMMTTTTMMTMTTTMMRMTHPDYRAVKEFVPVTDCDPPPVEKDSALVAAEK